MAIVEALKGMIVALDGDATGVETISDAIVVLTPLVAALVPEDSGTT